MTPLIDFNKYGITIARPNNNTTPANLDSDIMEQGAGVQFCAMCFQNKDSFLKQYEEMKFFNSDVSERILNARMLEYYDRENKNHTWHLLRSKFCIISCFQNKIKSFSKISVHSPISPF